MKKNYPITLFLGCALFAAASAWALNQLYVNEDGTELYDAPSPDANIVTMLSKDVALDVLEVSASGYTRVHTPDNWEGWVISQALTGAPSATGTAQVNPAAASPSGVPGMLTVTPVTPLPVPENPVSDAIPATPAQGSVITDQSLPVDNSLQASLAAARQELASMREKNSLLKDENNRHWFLTGAGVLLLGFIIGLIVPKIRWRRKSWHSY